MFRETKISILVTGSLLIHDPKAESGTVNQILANHGVVLIVYLGNRKRSTIFGMEGEQGYISAIFSPSKSKISTKNFRFNCCSKKHRFLHPNMLKTGIKISTESVSVCVDRSNGTQTEIFCLMSTRSLTILKSILSWIFIRLDRSISN